MPKFKHSEYHETFSLTHLSLILWSMMAWLGFFSHVQQSGLTEACTYHGWVFLTTLYPGGEVSSGYFVTAGIEPGPPASQASGLSMTTRARVSLDLNRLKLLKFQCSKFMLEILTYRTGSIGELPLCLSPNCLPCWIWILHKTSLLGPYRLP